MYFEYLKIESFIFQPKKSVSPNKKSHTNDASVKRVLKDLEYDTRENIDLSSPRSLRSRIVVSFLKI